MNFSPLSEKEECIAGKIVDAAYTVHKTLGPGLLEKVYEVCLCHEFYKQGLKFQRQVDIPIEYDGIIFNTIWKSTCSARGNVLMAQPHT